MPWDCVKEVLSVDELRDLTENASSWRVTVTQNGEIKEKGQKVQLCVCNKHCVDSLLKKTRVQKAAQTQPMCAQSPAYSHLRIIHGGVFPP
jgi:hypothetical protein